MNVLTMYSEVREYLSTGVWRVRTKELSTTKALAVKTLRVGLIAIRGYGKHRCALRASALTFYSLLSVVPVVAMLFGIAKGFGYQSKLESQLLEKFAEHEAVVRQVLEFSGSLLKSTKGGLVAGIGVFLLFWTLIRVMGNIEASFNDIWGIRVGRTVLRKFTDYLTIMLIAPFNFILSGSATVLIASQITNLGESLGLTEVASSVLAVILTLIPWVLMWLVFGFIYIIVPNTTVKWRSGLIAGLVAGVAFQLAQILFIEFQVGVSSYNAIYGGFAALPLFLVWLQLSWMIALFGAELSCAIQNVDSYEYAPRLHELSAAKRKLLSLNVAHNVVKSFADDAGPKTVSTIAAELGVPTATTQDAVADLLESGLFSQVVTEGEPAFQPASDIGQFTIAFVLEKLENAGSNELPADDSDELDALRKSLADFGKTLRSSPANKLLTNL